MLTGRLVAHLPWIAATAILVLIVGLDALIHEPASLAAARSIATDAAYASLPRDVRTIETFVRTGDLDALTSYVASSEALPGVERILLVDPDGSILASLPPGQQGRSVQSLNDPAHETLISRLNTAFAPEVDRVSGSDRVALLASVVFPQGNGADAGPRHGVLYEDRNLGPVIRPVKVSFRVTILITAVLILLVALPLQLFVYAYVTRRLQRLAEDVGQFGNGVRKGLFVDTGRDQIGEISGLLRTITQDVAGREVVAQRLNLAIESANAGIWDWDIEAGIIETNAQYHTMLGDVPAAGPIAAEELLDRVHPEDNERIRSAIRRLLKGMDPLYEAEFRMRGAGGAYTWIRSTGRVVARDASGRAMRTLGQHVDISSRKRSEERERLLGERFRKMFEGGAHGIMVLDRDLRFVMINRVGAGDMGRSPEGLIGQKLEEVLPAIYPVARERIAALLSSNAVRESEDEITIRGERRWFRSIAQPIEDDGGRLEWVHVTAYDTTVRHRSEENLRAQTERFRSLVESTSAILWEGNPETLQFTYVNREAEKVLGYAVGQWTDEPVFWANHVHPGDRERTVRNRRLAVDACEEHTLEYRMVAADGRVVWLRDMVSVLSEGGRPTKLVGVLIDITREKEEEARFQAAFESIPIGNIIMNDQGIIQLANPAAEEIFGYHEEELIGQNVSMLMPSPDREEHDDYIRSYLETGIAKVIGGSREAVGLRKSGEEFPLRLAVGEMRRGDIRTFVGSIVDLSDVKNLENQLVRSQKMEAVGQLAGGIAHDFNNLLHVINGFVELARESLPADAPVQVELAQIGLAGERAAALTRQLLAFSRRQVMQPAMLDLNDVIARITSMLERVIGEHIQLEVLSNPHLARVYADMGMIEQVLMNLCVNARDAMPDGGHLFIETENVVISESYCSDHLWAKPGRYVLISVTDTGCGMGREMQEHIFEPFYTTKLAQQGTGLGLSTVYGIVKQHDGIINVYSEVGKGTTFKVYLPHSERLAEHVGTKIEGEVPLGTETILVVEDDEAVRSLTRVMLESAGYTVLEAGDGRKALRCFRENLDGIHLVLLDVVMPDMGGREAYDEMLKITPGLRALFASGYSENAIHTNFVLDSGLALLKKPYARNELLRAVRRLLDSGDAGESV